MHGSQYIAAACFLSFLGLTGVARTQSPRDFSAAADRHQTEEWKLVAPHLPNPLTAQPDELERAADVLRARRFPDDALIFYRAAILNGGDRSRLLKKQGVLELELQHGLLAHLYFDQAVHLNKQDASAWNNLGAADFMLGNTRTAIGEYKHAVKANKMSAVFHSNLALAYFEARDTRNARQELGRALVLDPDILHHNDSGGYNLQVLASTHYAEICFEMARVSAAQGDQEGAISWLTKASERGLDVRAMLKGDPQLSPYLQDDRIKVMLANNEQLKTRGFPPRVNPPALNSAATVQSP